MDLRLTSNVAAAAKIGNPEGCFLAGAWRRCSSVTERCGYAPSSRLASRPPENSAPIPYIDMGSAFGSQTRVRGRRWLWLVMLFALVSRSFSANFTASLDRTSVVLGDQVVLTLNFVNGQPQEFSGLPQIEGLRYVSQEQSQNFTIDNGAQSVVFSYTVAIQPMHVGEFTIPAFHAKMNGQIVSSEPITLKVAASDSSASSVADENKPAFLRIVLPKTNLFINEPVVAEFSLYFRSDVHRYSNPENLVPDGNGLTFGRFVEGAQYQRRVGGGVFTVLPLSITITPVKTGTLSINPITATIVLNNQDPMDFGFFRPRMTPQKVTLTSDRIDLEVSPLPSENLPPGFNGAVGTYTMSVTAGPTNVVAGDPVTLHVQISGHGALDSLVLPEQTGWDRFKVYPPTSKLNLSDQLGLQGSKTFEEIVTPQDSDIKALPPVSFSFFDPDQKVYRTLTQPGIPLVVRAATPGVMPAMASNAHSGQENSAAAPDILPIKQRLGALAQIQPPLIRQPLFLGLQSVPVVAFISAFFWRRRKESLANNPRLRRQRQVAQLVRDGLAELQNSASENKSDEFFATLFRLVQEQLGERLDMPASSITEAVIEERLRPRNVPQATLDSLHEMFHTCNLARYAPIESSQELAAIIPKLEQLLNELRELKI
jgi:hypothetical protein